MAPQARAAGGDEHSPGDGDDAGAGGLRVFFTTYATTQAVAHYRLGLPGAALAARGHRCFFGPMVMVSSQGAVGVLDDNSVVRGLDVVVVQPGPGTEWQGVSAACRKGRQALVVDLDDWWWDTPSSNGVWQNEGFGPWRRKLERLVLEADLVTASTPFIAGQVGGWAGAPPVRVLRNALDLSRWGPREDVGDGPVVGYAGSLYGHLEDVHLLRGWLGEFVSRHGLRVVHYGAHPSLPDFAANTGLDAACVDARPGQPWSAYAASRPMAGMDIGLVPLVDRPFNLAKSALKGMEYAACGVPFVASPTPEYQWLGCGRMAGASLAEQGPEAWVQALEGLLDPAVRRRLADAQYARAQREDISVRVCEWEDAYVSAVAGARA
jgi:glycosyltransferase involved in cell wall biosynthesis